MLDEDCNFSMPGTHNVWINYQGYAFFYEITVTDTILGDCNFDGSINQYDYIYVKRFHFKTLEFSAAQMLAADVNEDGDVDQYDYILIKRHHFGTYSISQ